MTSFQIENGFFASSQVDYWARQDAKFSNWPVVYLLSDPRRAYVGESTNVASRFRQHMAVPERRSFKYARVVLDPTFNKSVCLDLESYLIQRLSGDGKLIVTNRNIGISDRDYYRRDEYHQVFGEIFERLREEGVFEKRLDEIENSELFKLSPFKSLTVDQEQVVLDILEGLFEDIENGARSQVVVQGEPGTGKTVVAVYLMKLLRDIAAWDGSEPLEADSPLVEFFVEGYPELARNREIGIVVPQQALRATLKRVFRRTPGLKPSMVLSPFTVGGQDKHYDLLLVDEAHRLRHGGNLGSGPQYGRFKEINRKLFGEDVEGRTQLDWITARSDHQIFFLDVGQTVHTGDVTSSDLARLGQSRRKQDRRYRLSTQMRVRAGEDYIGYVRQVLSDVPPERREFAEYDLHLFDDLGEMREAVLAREAEVGLSRMVAGFAWPWLTKNDPDEYDIVEGGVKLRWNSTDVDWVSSATSPQEVGVIHTIQGYDLNYAGVIIGRDLRYDPQGERLYFDRSHYKDPSAAKNMPSRGITFTDDDILGLVRNIYSVLLTRGIRGTYVYACDEPLREYLRRLF